jgi:membrane protein
MAGVKRITDLIAQAQRLKPVRVFQYYAGKRGPILSGGLAYSALFAIFAGVALLFSVAGLVLAGDDVLRGRLVDALASAVPGLVDSGDGSGAIDPEDLLGSTATFNVAGLIALAGLLVTALGFLGSARDAIRDMFDLPIAAGNFALMKLKDLAFLLGFLVTFVVSTALSVAGAAATETVLGLLGIDDGSPAGYVLGRGISLVLVAAIDAVVVAMFVRVLAGIRVPVRRLVPGALIGGSGIAVLTLLFQLGIIRSTSNPLVASFVVILGLLVFFNLICQVLLVSAAWTAMTLRDQGISVNAPGVRRMRRTARPRISGPHLRSEV